MTKKQFFEIRARRAGKALENRKAAYASLANLGGEGTHGSILSEMARGVKKPVFSRKDK